MDSAEVTWSACPEAIAEWMKRMLNTEYYDPEFDEGKFRDPPKFDVQKRSCSIKKRREKSKRYTFKKC